MLPSRREKTSISSNHYLGSLTPPLCKVWMETIGHPIIKTNKPIYTGRSHHAQEVKTKVENMLEHTLEAEFVVGVAHSASQRYHHRM